MRELLETEQTYVDGLEMCIGQYFEGLLEAQARKIISADDLKFLFGDIATIHQLNATFLKDLRASYANFNNNSSMIGDQFVKFCPYFRYLLVSLSPLSLLQY